MTTKFWRNYWAGGWAIIGALLFLFVCFGGCNPAKGASFGNTSTSSSYDAGNTNARVHVSSTFMLAVAADIDLDSISLYCKSVDGSSITVDLAIYRRRNSMATDLLASGTMTFNHSNPAWKAIPITLTVSAGDTICIAEGNATSSNFRVGRTNVSNAGSYSNAATLANPWASGGLSTYPISAYAVYHVKEAAAAAARRTRIMKIITAGE